MSIEEAGRRSRGKRTVSALIIGIALGLTLGTSFAAAPARWIEVSGFQVNMNLTPESQEAQTVGNLQHQISIVDAARLPGKVQSFFHTVRIVIDPSLTGMNGQYVQIDGAWVVRARPGQWPADRAILLHELLHAYHREVLGQPTPPVGRALAEALREGTYPPEYKDAYSLLFGERDCA